MCLVIRKCPLRWAGIRSSSCLSAQMLNVLFLLPCRLDQVPCAAREPSPTNGLRVFHQWDLLSLPQRRDSCVSLSFLILFAFPTIPFILRVIQKHNAMSHNVSAINFKAKLRGYCISVEPHICVSVWNLHAAGIWIGMLCPGSCWCF